MLRISTALCLFAATTSFSPAFASTIVNFETGYNDNQLLDDPTVLQDSNGDASQVTLTTQNDNTMSIEATGTNDGNPQGFVNDPLGVSDTETSGDLGDFFLRTTTALSGDYLTFNPVFSLIFDGGASSVSGEIWDIDGNRSQGTEMWNVVVRDLMDNVITTIESPEYGNTADATSLNGQAWNFAFTGQTVGSLDFVFAGTKTSGIGVAFDNLTYTAAVPLPAGGLLLMGALASVAMVRRRKAA